MTQPGHGSAHSIVEANVGAAPPNTKSAGPKAKQTLLVVAAVLYDGSGRLLIAQRPSGKHMAGRWEFPGGKVMEGETEGLALARELREELGIELRAARPFMRLAHAYEDREVQLSLWLVGKYSGEPRGLDGQALKWVEPGRLAQEDILEADRPFVDALCTMEAPLSTNRL